MSYKVTTRERRMRDKHIYKTVKSFEDWKTANAFYREESKRLWKLAEQKKLVNYKLEIVSTIADEWGSHGYNAECLKDTWSLDDPEIDLSAGKSESEDEEGEEDDEEDD